MKDAVTMKAELKKLIDTAAGRIPADLVIKNCKVVNVFSGKIQEGDIAFSGDQIAGIGEYEGKEVIDAEGRYAAPGFIDSHIHIESSYVCPEEIGRLLVPHGGTTIMADPHEIVNVCGIAGLDYMMKAAENTVLDVKYELPSCVPATPFDSAGSELTSDDILALSAHDQFVALSEMMNVPGVLQKDAEVIRKLEIARNRKLPVDGHAPGLSKYELKAYAEAGISTDHECVSLEEALEKIASGMKIIIREGSAAQNFQQSGYGRYAENARQDAGIIAHTPIYSKALRKSPAEFFAAIKSGRRFASQHAVVFLSNVIHHSTTMSEDDCHAKCCEKQYIYSRILLILSPQKREIALNNV